MSREPGSPADPERRQTIRRVGGWIIYSGTVSAAALVSCGRTPLGLPFADDDDAGTNPTTSIPTSPTPTGSPTPVEVCGCPQVPGPSVGLNVTDLPVNNVAYNSGLRLFICHDAAGFYAMTSICTHAGQNIPDTAGTNYTPNNLSLGFFCGFHSSTFNKDGVRIGGPAVLPLQHYRLGVAADGTIHVDTLTPYADPTCRCDANGQPV